MRYWWWFKWYENINDSNGNCDGGLPSEIGQLNNLNSMYLFNNYFSGTIPEGFTNNSGIPLSMGYSRAIVRFAFDNANNSVSDRIITNNCIAIFRIIGNNEKSIKPY